MRRKAMHVKAQSGMEATYSAATTAATATTSSSSTTLTSSKSTMVGVEKVHIQLLHELSGLPSSRQVIPVVGIGGIGKTTLARDAFKHPYIMEHFDVCLWATISQQYSTKKIFTQLTSVDESETSNGDVDELGLWLHKTLYKRRYLIIRDDMWSLEAWNELKNLFPDNDNGSRILVTTRHLDVADHFSVSRGVKMSFLDEDSSWDLFCQKAFEAEQCCPPCPPELEGIGKKIVEKCKGLPLAIVVVAGHLRNSSMALDYWENAAHHLNSILNSTENEEQCMNVLSLSYSYLPAHLKPCFLLLAAFPEDEILRAGDIVRLWIAEGLVEAFEGTRSEDVAEGYLRDLFDRNLILVDAFGFTGVVSRIKLHDLVRELCLQIAIKEEFLYVLDTPRAISRERRVIISGKYPELNHQTKTIDAPIRCVVCNGDCLSYDFKLLRTLNKVVASSTGTKSISRHVNLRHLNVDLYCMTRPTLYCLPSSISLLWNLQTLKINVPIQSKVIAPYEVWELLQLRHLVIEPICLVDPLPPADRSDNGTMIRNLHTLWGLENFRLSEEACKRIPNVRSLKLMYGDEADFYYSPQNLGSFHELEYLVLRFHDDSKWRGFALSLGFPTSLKIL